MQRFDIPYNQSTITVRQSEKHLFSIDIDNSFVGYIFKKNGVYSLQESSKLPIDAYEMIVSELKSRL